VILVKQVANRQKLVVKPRENIQKYLSKQKEVRKPARPGRGHPWRGSSGSKAS
jgi:hypothetical protein